MKPDVLSDEELYEMGWREYPDKSNIPLEAQKRRAIAQAQRDADVEWFDKWITGRFTKARQDTAKEIFEKGEGDCPHAGTVAGEALLHKRECWRCWDSLKSKYLNEYCTDCNGEARVDLKDCPKHRSEYGNTKRS